MRQSRIPSGCGSSRKSLTQGWDTARGTAPLRGAALSPNVRFRTRDQRKPLVQLLLSGAIGRRALFARRRWRAHRSGCSPTRASPTHQIWGTERVIHSLTEELVRRGHEVTLFASGDSVTSARLEPIVERAIWHHPRHRDHLPFVIAELQTVLDRADEFDVIHSHLDYLAFPFARISPTPWVHTLHGRMDLSEYQQLYRKFSDARVVSISNNQRRPVPFANWVATVYNGIAVDEYPFQPVAGDYLAFVGRIAPEKNLHVAIEVALKAEIPLKIAARMPLPHALSPNDSDDWTYYAEQIKPHLDNPLIEYVGEVDEQQKRVLLRHAAALINPVNWPEPFGLVMAEALACGTPVIAKRAGSVPEIVDHGRTRIHLRFRAGDDTSLRAAFRNRSRGMSPIR